MLRSALEVSPTGRCSLLVRLSINSQSPDHLELASKELWSCIRLFSGGDELNIIGIQYMVYRQVIGVIVYLDYKEDRA